MNPIFEDKLKTISEDKLLIDSLKALFNERAEKEKPEDESLSDEIIGQSYRGYLASKRIIDKGFKDLEGYVFSDKSNKTKNRAK